MLNATSVFTSPSNLSTPAEKPSSGALGSAAAPLTGGSVERLLTNVGREGGRGGGANEQRSEGQRN